MGNLDTSFLERLLLYHHQTNQQFGNFLLSLPEPVTPRVLQLFAHLIQAHALWNQRMAALEAPKSVWEETAVTTLLGIDAHNFAQSVQLLRDRQPNEQIAYRTMQGTPMAHSMADLLFHVINHGTYHRGQMVLLLKEQGVQAPPSDFVLFKG